MDPYNCRKQWFHLGSQNFVFSHNSDLIYGQCFQHDTTYRKAFLDRDTQTHNCLLNAVK